jgi:hemoglobin-like flavoprotein
MHLDLDTLEASMDKIAPCGDELMDTFYRRLFAAVPSMVPLHLGQDLERVKAALLGALTELPGLLRNVDTATSVLRGLGARNARYGALPHHYPVAATLFLSSMSEIAGHAWTDTDEAAWTQALAFVSDTLRDGALRATAAA